MIVGIPSRELGLVQDQVWPFLENFAERSLGRVTAEGLFEAIRVRDRQLWVLGDWQAVVLTSVGRESVTIEHCAGTDREDWQQEVDETICAWARSLGKRRVFSLARPGWAKYARERGFREIHREWVKEI